MNLPRGFYINIYALALDFIPFSMGLSMFYYKKIIEAVRENKSPFYYKLPDMAILNQAIRRSNVYP